MTRLAFILLISAYYTTKLVETRPFLEEDLDYGDYSYEEDVSDALGDYKGPLYPAVFPVLHLNSSNFNTKVHCNQRSPLCTALVVQFYDEYSTESRNYMPNYLAMSLVAETWKKIIQFAVVNCGDSQNEDLCEQHGFDHKSPLFKYFKRSSTSRNLGQTLELTTDTKALFREIIDQMLREYRENHYRDWPNFIPMPQIHDHMRIWDDLPMSVRKMVIVHVDDTHDPIGLTYLIDATEKLRGDGTPVRLVTKDHLISQIHKLHDYPAVTQIERRWVYPGQHAGPDTSSEKKLAQKMENCTLCVGVKVADFHQHKETIHNAGSAPLHVYEPGFLENKQPNRLGSNNSPRHMIPASRDLASHSTTVISSTTSTQSPIQREIYADLERSDQALGRMFHKLRPGIQAMIEEKEAKGENDAELDKYKNFLKQFDSKFGRAK